MYVSLFLLALVTGTRLISAYPQTSGSTSPSTWPEYVNETSFRIAVMTYTNAYRAKHNSQYVAWHPTLVNYAQGWTNQCRWAHSVSTILGLIQTF